MSRFIINVANRTITEIWTESYINEDNTTYTEQEMSSTFKFDDYIMQWESVTNFVHQLKLYKLEYKILGLKNSVTTKTISHA